MSITNVSDLFVPEVCAEYANKAFVQSLGLYSLMGPEGSGAPIELMSDPVVAVEGQYKQRPVLDQMGSALVTRQDITSNSGVTPQKMTGSNEQMVKLFRKIGPVDFTYNVPIVTRADGEQLSRALGEQAGQQLALNYQESILAALNGMVDAMTATAHTNTVWAAATRTNLSPSVLSSGLALMGDRREFFKKTARIVTRSECAVDLQNDGIGRSYPNVGDRALQGARNTNTLGMGDPVEIDSSRLTVADAGFDKYITLLLGSGCLQIDFCQPMKIYPLLNILDNEQAQYRWRADSAALLGGHGLSYNSGAGGANPTDTNLASSANWSVVYSQAREVQIIKNIHNMSSN